MQILNKGLSLKSGVPIQPGVVYVRELVVHEEINIKIGEDNSLFFFIEEGSLNIEINGKNFLVSEKQFMILLAGDTIHIDYKEHQFNGYAFITSINFLIEYTNKFKLYHYLNLFRFNPLISLSEQNAEYLKIYKYVLDKKLNQTTGYYELNLTFRALIEAIGAEVMEACSKIGSYTDNGIINRSEFIYKQFITLLAKEEIHPRNVKWYADKLNISPKVLLGACMNVTGKPASEWIKEYLMIDIKKTLADSNLTIKEAAYILNYPNLTYFGKCVRRWFGITPTELRYKLLQKTDIP